MIAEKERKKRKEKRREDKRRGGKPSLDELVEADSASLC